MKRLFTLSVVAFVLVLICESVGLSQGASGYHLLKKIGLGGEGGWDYLFSESTAHRLYVSHATKVVVVDTETQAVVGEIPNTNGVHGIAIAPDLGRGFTSNGRDNSVTIFDLKTLKAIGSVATGKNPDAILFDPASKRVFTFNGGSANATAFDAATGKVENILWPLVQSVYRHNEQS